MKPDASTYDPRPEYLLELVKSTGMPRAALARDVLGVTERCLQMWLQGRQAGGRQFPYTAQFALEQLVLGV